jgi:hypothetical protein
MNACEFTTLKPHDAKRLLDEGRAILIDVSPGKPRRWLAL